MKKLLLIFSILFSSFVLFGISRYYELERYQDKNESLSEVAKHFEEVQTENERLKTIQVDTNKFEELRKETEELMRLRAKVSQLRQVVNKSDNEFDAELSAAASRLDKLQATYQSEVDWIVGYCNQSLRELFTGVLSGQINNYFGEHGEIPDSLEGLPKDFLWEIDGLRQGLLNDYPSLPSEYVERVGVTLDDYELLPTPIKFTAESQPSGSPLARARETQLILREKTSHQLPDGNWERYYGGLRNSSGPFGSVSDMQRIELEVDEFDRWERELAEQTKNQ